MAQSNSAPPPRKGEPLGKRAYTLRLTFASLVTAGIVLFIGFCWAFIMGVMVGRGYNPENKMPQLASFMPAEDRAAQTSREKLEDSLPRAEVMRPEELRYSTTLRGKPGQNATETVMRPMHNATGAVSSTATAAMGQAATGQATRQTTGQAAGQAAGQTAPQATPPPQTAQPKPPVEPLFDFVLQVATFKDTGSVDKLRARLEGAGLRSRMDKDGKLLKVVVLLRGTNEAGQNLRQQMLDMGLGQPLQRAKTPVRQSRR